MKDKITKVESLHVNQHISNEMLYAAFSKIPLDIYGSNLDLTGWMPSEKDKETMDERNYAFAVEEYKKRNAKVMFTNVSLQWDICACSEYCSHGSGVYEMEIKNRNEIFIVELEDLDSLVFDGPIGFVKIPIENATIFDFYRACELSGIELELSDYALSLLE